MAALDVVIRFVGDASNAVAAANKVEGEYSSLSSKLTKTGVAMTAGITLPFVALGKASIDAASNLEESLTQSQAVFGKHAAAVEQWAAGASRDFGQSKQQALEAAAGFGNMFDQMGIGIPVAANMSKSMVELASDFASFKNADISDVLAAQEAAFRGEYDALQRFVPTINAAAVETKALAMTGKENADSLTAQEKATATYKLMLEGAGKALGDFDRTADGAANKQRELAAQFADLQAEIGGKLLPVFVQLAGVAGVVLDAFSSLPDGVQTAVVAFGAFAAALGPVLTIGANLGKLGSGISSAFNAIGTAVQLGAVRALELGEAFVAAAAGIGVLVGAAAVIGGIGYALHLAFGEDLAGQIRDSLSAGQEFGAALVAQTSQIADYTARHDQLAATLRDLENARVEDFDAAVKNAAAQREVKGAMTELEAAHAAAANAERVRKAEIDALAGSTLNLAAATDAQRAAIEGVTNAYLAAQGGIIGYEAANLRVEASQARLDALIAGGSLPTSLEYRQAVNDLAAAKLAATSATFNLAGADADLAKIATQENVPALTAMRDSLFQTAWAHGDASAATVEQIEKINELIRRAEATPPQKSTKFDAETDQALRDIENYAAAVDRATVARTTYINTLWTGTPPPWWREMGLTPSFASGGIVPGRTGQAVPVLAHGGERIVPARDVRAYDRAARSGGTSSSTSGQTFNISIKVDPTVSAAEVGARTVDAIRQYERVAGKAWRG